MAGLVIPATMEVAREIPYRIVIESLFLFLLADGAEADGDSSGARNLWVVMLR